MVSSKQFPNVPSSIEVTPAGMDILVILLPINAPFPIEVTLAGIDILVRL